MIVRLFVVASFALTSVVAQPRTLVVDQSAGPYTAISAAIAASQPGDRVEVHPGNYAGFTVSSGLDIFAPQGGVFVRGLVGIAILNVPAQQAVRIDGLELDGTFVPAAGVFGATFVVRGCAGIVHLHRFRTSICRSSIENSARVALSLCMFNGVPGDAATGTAPSAGLLLTNASAVLDFCWLFGGLGGPSDGYHDATGGGYALVLQQSSAFLSQCTATGGAGGDGLIFTRAGPGGNGASGDGASQLCAVGNGGFVGGAAGSGGISPSSPGLGIAPGSLMALRFGPVVQFTPAGAPFTAVPEPPHLSAPTLLWSSTIAAIQVTNTTDQAVLLGIDLWNDLIPLPGVELPFVLTPAASLYAFALPSPASSAQFPLAVPSAPWLLQQFVHLQAVTVTSRGTLQFSNGGYGRIT